MKKERMAILKMINDGKINVDEGIKLMNSIKGTKAFDASEVISDVKDKVCDFVEDARPVVKKYANMAMEMGEDVYTKGKAKVEEYKSKAKSRDFVDEVIIEPVNNAADFAEDIIDDTAEKADEIVEDVKDNVEDMAEKFTD